MDQMLLTVYDSIAVAFEMFIVHLYLTVFFDRKRDNRAWLAPYFAFGILMVVLSRFYPNMYLLLIVTLLRIMTISTLVFEGPWLSRIFASFLFCLIAVITEAASSWLISTLAAMNTINVLEYGALRIIGSILANLIFLFIVKVMSVFTKTKADPTLKRLKELIPLVIFLVFSVILVVVCFSDTLTYRDQYSVTAILEVLAIAYMNILVFLYYDRLMRTRELEHEKEAMDINTNSQVKYYEIVRKQQDTLRALLHDAKIHESTMAKLAERSADAQAEEYLSHYKSSLEAEMPVVNTPNSVVNVILSDCIARAMEKGIHPSLDIGLADDFSIDSVDITVILGNTIENALRALSDLPEDYDRQMRILLKQRNRFLVYDISNSYMPKTSPSSRMGYGLRNVKKCISKYRGEMRLSKGDAIYTVAITLQLP